MIIVAALLLWAFCECVRLVHFAGDAWMAWREYRDGKRYLLGPMFSHQYNYWKCLLWVRQL